jgi:hypothetical protein
MSERPAAPPRQIEPARFCAYDGVETGIHVAEGLDLCLDCFRDYVARGRKLPDAPPGSPATRRAAAAAQPSLFEARR